MDYVVNIDESFTGSMHRAYLDLGYVDIKYPHHLIGIDFGIKALIEDRDYPRIQSALGPSFRMMLIRQTGLYQYLIDKPQALKKHLRTERWEILIQYCNSYDTLSIKQKSRLAWLIGKMCFHPYLIELLSSKVYNINFMKKSNTHASLSYLYVYARYRIYLDDNNSPYSLDEFKVIAENAPFGITKIDAHYQMVVQNVKHYANLEEAEKWQKRHLAVIEESKNNISNFEYLFAMSRYYRVGGFIPQMKQDATAVIKDMDLAEKYALELPHETLEERIAANEALYPVIESRTKEAIWLKNFDLAISQAKKLTELSPFDSRARLHIGSVYLEQEMLEEALESYIISKRYSPPGKDIATFMIAQCHYILGEIDLAIDECLESIKIDPLAISSYELLDELLKNQQTNNILLHEWVKNKITEFKNNKNEITDLSEPYKVFPSPKECHEKL